MWDVKAGASYGNAQYQRVVSKDLVAAERSESEAEERGGKSSRLLGGMRACMALSVLCVLFGVGQLVVAFWTQPFPPAEPNKVLQGDAPEARA